MEHGKYNTYCLCRESGKSENLKLKRCKIIMRICFMSQSIWKVLLPGCVEIQFILLCNLANFAARLLIVLDKITDNQARSLYHNMYCIKM